MAGASKLIVLLTTPFSILRPRPSLLRLARLSSSSLAPQSVSLHHLTNSPTSRPKLVFQLKASQQIHTQTNSLKEDNFGDSVGFSSPNHRASHPWPEWSKLVDTLSAGGYFDWQRFTAAEGHGIGVEDAFVAYEDLSEEFVHTARACLAFALDRSNLLGSLSRNDIEVVVDNGTPFLFKSALDTSRRMRSFLGSGGSKVLEFDKAHMVDLMKYLLSYASNTIVSSESNSLYNGVLVEPSVRNLLSQLAELSCRVSEPDLSASVQYQLPHRYGQTPRPVGQKIEMKRGDWICPRCNFMNFARNAKCLECEEARPKRQLIGGEWECPQCDFFNYGRNIVCLRCDCKRPGEASSSAPNSRPGLRYKYGDYANKVDVDSRLAANEEKAQRWFSKVSELGNASDLSKAATDEDFPEIMPLRKGVNRFVVSTRKTPLERRLANSQYQRNLGNDGTREDNHIQTGDPNKTIDTSISKSLDEILGRTSTVSDTDNKSTLNGQITGTESSPPRFSSASPQYGQSKGSSSSYVPFVPLPADMFSKKTQNPKIEDSEKAVTGSIESVSLEALEQTGSVSGSSDSGRPGDNFQFSEKSVSQAESQIKDKEQAEKSERWFKKVAELHDVTDLASAISDEDFPEIMPMRKGDNRFVVSKKKDRSLSSATYKRRMAMEQADNTNFVPFVPFPPDYFAKKDGQQSDGANSTGKATGEISSISAIPEKLPEKLDDAKPGVTDMDHLHGVENQHSSTGGRNLESSGENLSERKTDAVYGTPIGGNPTQSSFTSQTNSKDNWSTGHSGKVNTTEATNMTGSSPQPPENQNVRSGWTGKSLEGSAVKEPDPLDMSEEAKAERWFRRVAQIKDISELSQIPDEDFPSIMPMRKGVNRFVVSKRKTPLERRLTSPQYRRNLPVVSSEPMNKENDKS